MATFDLWQQVYSLGQMAGAIGGLVGDAKTLTKWLVDKQTAFYKNNVTEMGSWATVWGPVVFEHNDNIFGTADNVMYVAANVQLQQYVVCIAGTNALSKYDWDDEDNAVSTTTTWAAAFPQLPPYRTPAGLNPYISSGTQLGVTNLLGMTDGTTGQSLAAFLPTVQSAFGTLVFTGHSLGGALSPTLALALFNSNGGQLDPARWNSVYLYPTAGPTPGNADFATYVTQQFAIPKTPPPEKPYQYWNQNVWNTLDLVPQGWVVELLQQAPYLYPHSNPWPPQDLTDMINQYIGWSNAGAATGAGPYTRLANQSLTGTFNPDYPVTDKTSFEKQAGYQHTTAYDILLGVSGVAKGSWSQAEPQSALRTSPPKK